MTWVRTVLDLVGSQPIAGNPRQCVAHDDASPSLSVFARRDGSGAGLTCHAGCTLTDILNALRMPREWLTRPPTLAAADHVRRARLAERLRFPPLDARAGQHPAARGARLEAVHRYGHRWVLERWRETDGAKDLRWATLAPSGITVPGLRDLPPDGLPLYNEPEITAAVVLGEPVILVESESSADALAGHYATTWAGGATHIPIARIARVVGGYHRLVVIPDHDQSGMQALQRLHEHGLAPHVLLPPPGYDARDLYQQLGGTRFRTAVQHALDNPADPTSTDRTVVMRRRSGPVEEARMRTQPHQARREAQLEQMQTTLNNEITGLVSGEDWRRAMEFATRFRSRSFNNTVLIHAQHQAAYEQGRVPAPSPTFVAGFHQWLNLGRHVTKGQTGYRIFAPVTARFATATPDDPTSWRRLASGESPKPGEQAHTRIVGLRPAYVWDVSQTSGEPIPEPPAPELLQGQAPSGLWDALSAQVVTLGFTITPPAADDLGRANGVTDFTTHTVTVRSDLDGATRVKTLAHELGHITLHGIDDTEASGHRGIAEVEAETFALMIAAAHGLDTRAYTIPYVASWANTVPGETPTEVVQATAERVRNAAVAVLERLDTPQISSGDPPGLDRDADPPARRTHVEIAPSTSATMVSPGTLTL